MNDTTFVAACLICAAFEVGVLWTEDRMADFIGSPDSCYVSDIQGDKYVISCERKPVNK